MEILQIFKQTEALLEGHFLLTSGLHSPNYFQCAKVLQFPKHCENFCRSIAEHFRNDKIDVVISPAVGGIVVGTEVGRILDTRTIFAERQDGKMTLRRGFSVSKGENVLVTEDVVTTGGSVFEVIELVKSFGANVVGVGYVVDRSNGKVDFGVKKISLLQVEVITFKAEDCPLCKQGSEATKPGSRTLKK